MRKQILLVDDDKDLREVLAEQIASGGDYTVKQAGDAAEAIGHIKSDRFDLMIFDVGLPDADGRDMVKVVREHGVQTPIIMLTAQDTEKDVIRGLNSGANDYVTKPFKIAILLARIKAQLRQHELSEDATLPIGVYEFRPNSKTLTLNDEVLRLTEKESNILKQLYRAKGSIVSRETLLGEVWGYSEAITTHTLETHIYRLRKKIENDETGSIILTGEGGYRLTQSSKPNSRS